MLSGLSNLQQRVVSAVALAAIVLLVSWAGSWIFRLLVCLAAIVVFLEWQAMTRGDLRPVRPAIIAVFMIAILPVLAGLGAAVGLAVGLVLGLAAFLIAETRHCGAWIARGFAYAFLPSLAIVTLRGDHAAGLVAILFLFAVVWATDIGAYFVGRALGGPRLAPSISPGKTWSGAIGGLLAGAIAGQILALVAGTASGGTLFAALLLSVASQFGDLYESSVKREANVKDSSQLIPGHGGVMDRIDGLAFAAVALYLLVMLGIHPGLPFGNTHG